MNTATLVYAAASALLIISIFAPAFIEALRKNKWAVIDTAWGLGFVAVVWLGAALFPAAWQKITAAMLIILWGIRPAWHLWQRNARLPEAPRYAAISRHEARIRRQASPFNLPQCFSSARAYHGRDVPAPLYVFPSISTQRAFGACGFGYFLCALGIFWKWTADIQLKHFAAAPKKIIS